MQGYFKITPWPALLTLERACDYLSLDHDAFLSLMAKWRIEAVEVGGHQTMWRTRDLDALLRKLPTVKSAPLAPDRGEIIQSGQMALEKIAETIEARLQGKLAVAHDRPQLASIRETCAQLGLSRTKIYSLINEGRLQVRRIGGRTMITQVSIDALVCP